MADFALFDDDAAFTEENMGSKSYDEYFGAKKDAEREFDSNVKTNYHEALTTYKKAIYQAKAKALRNASRRWKVGSEEIPVDKLHQFGKNMDYFIDDLFNGNMSEVPGPFREKDPTTEKGRQPKLNVIKDSIIDITKQWKKFNPTGDDPSFVKLTNRLTGKTFGKFDKALRNRLGGNYGRLKEASANADAAMKNIEDNLNAGKYGNIDDPDKLNQESFSKDMAELQGHLDDIDRIIPKDLEDQFNKEQVQRNQENGNPKKPVSKLSYIYSILKLLAIIGVGLFALHILNKYCANHSGCLMITNKAPYESSYSNFITYCRDGQILNPSKNYQTTYTPQQCYCSTFKSYPEPSSGDECGNTSNAESKFTPDNSENGSQFACIPASGNMDELKGKTYLYYSYIIMTPFDGLTDLATKGIDLGGDLLSKIVHAIIMVAIAIGVLFVLYIIIKLLSRRHEEFGRVSKSYLGNIGKFSHYGNSLALRSYSMKFR